MPYNEQPNWNQINEKKREEISFAQSWNLAVATIPEEWKESLGIDKDHLVQLEMRQAYFYEKLQRKQENIKQATTKSREIELKDKAMQSAEDNANEVYNEYQQENI